MKHLLLTLGLLAALALPAGAQVSSGAASIKTNSPVAFGSTVWAAQFQANSLAFKTTALAATNNQVINLTNAAVYVLGISGTTALRLTNFVQGGQVTLLLNGGGSARTVSYIWPPNVRAIWRTPTNSTLTNFTFVSIFMETNSAGTNRAHVRADVQ